MRNIKIRAWNVNENRFEENYYIKCCNGNEKMTRVKLEMDNFKRREINDEEIIFLLNTGLKDRNGVEAFHKDVVKDFRGRLYSIEWDESYANFVLKDAKNETFLPIQFLQYGDILGSALKHPEFM